MILRLERNATVPQRLLSVREVRSVGAEGDVTHAHSSPSDVDLLRLALNGKQRDARRAAADNDGIVAPDIGVSALESEHILVPLCRSMHIAHSEGHVVETFKDEGDGSQATLV